MYRVRVKICGITNVIDARMAEAEGADALGFVFWAQSPRVVPVARIGEISRVLSPMTAKIGIFYDAGVSDVEKTMRRSGLTGAQICGEPPEGKWRSLSRRARLIRVVGMNEDKVPEERPWDFGYDYMFDTGTEELPGGIGEPFDWSRLPENDEEQWGRIYVSGGLTAENVGKLIKEYRPYAVDVAAVVEGTNYRKDRDLVREFIRAVREAEYEVNRDGGAGRSKKSAPMPERNSS